VGKVAIECERCGRVMPEATDLVCGLCRSAERPVEADRLLVAALERVRAVARLEATEAGMRGDTLAASILMAQAAAIRHEADKRRVILRERGEPC
jgi:RNA polymerase subunit RPABC4/transcription elongation factor Spt4